MAVYQVIGKKRTVSKTSGKSFFNYFFMRDFTEYEKQNGDCLGHAIEVEGTALDFPVVPGDFVELSYTKGYQDKATLSEIKLVKSSK